MADDTGSHVAGDARQRLGRRLTEPLESAAQTVARRATDLVLESLDLNALLDQIDLNKLLDNVDVNRVVDRVDVNQVVDRVDVNTVLDHVDINRVLDRVDVNRILARVDVEALVDKVDVNKLVDRTELKTVLAKSSTTVFTEGIDLARSQAVGLDDFMARWVNRILRRKNPPPLGPPRLISLQAEP